MFSCLTLRFSANPLHMVGSCSHHQHWKVTATFRLYFSIYGLILTNVCLFLQMFCFHACFPSSNNNRKRKKMCSKPIKENMAKFGNFVFSYWGFHEKCTSLQLISYKRYLECTLLSIETIYLSLVHTGSWGTFFMKSLVPVCTRDR